MVRNIKEQVKTDLGFSPQFEREQGRIYLLLDGRDPADFYDSLNHVFGISSYSPAQKVSLDLEEIKETAVAEMRDAVNGPTRFRVSVKRPNKRFPHSSPEMQQIIAVHLLKNIPGLKADLHNADIDILLEIRFDAAYIYTKRFEGLGGLPLGSGGKALVMLSGGIDSPVAGWLAMKRGVTVEAVHFHSYPYTSEEAKDKVLELATLMAKYSNRMVIHLVPFTKIQEEIAHYRSEERRVGKES